MSYGIQPFKDDAVCDVSPLGVYDVFLGQPYMWKHHGVYESIPHSVIITMVGNLYMILEVFPTTTPPKKHCKVICHTAKIILFIVCSKDEHKTTIALTPYIQQKHIVEESKYIFSSPKMVHTRCPIQPRDNRLVEHIQPL
jgi:hypothetical protein